MFNKELPTQEILLCTIFKIIPNRMTVISGVDVELLSTQIVIST